MKLKKSVIILFWIIGYTYFSQLISSTTWRQKLFQNLPVWMQRFFAPEQAKKFTNEVRKSQELFRPLDLRSFFEQKEQNKSIIDPIQDAENLKQQ